MTAAALTPSTIRRTGLVLGTAVLGAAMLLALAAGPALAAPAAPAADPEAEPLIHVPKAVIAEPVAPRPIAGVEASEADWMGAGEARFETLPGLAPLLTLPGRRPGALAQAAITTAGRREPWLAAGLSLGLPLAFVAPALAGVWWPALAAPLAVAGGHLYAGDAERAVGVGLGGVGAAGAGALAGWGISQIMGVPMGGALGAGMGLGAYGVWAATDAYGQAGRATQVEVVTFSR